ncbi:hypothetical protein RclHR1_06560005 [Rhizophagus clarus]|uniref:Serine-threonine/tyrosine-protein kinase catalytic domain-containing protein n=1 Tax=Rhizophagus clarus TaxID=94130 RepID=A0A2Z6RTD3_9GLOM|nr:hypothetical protein RclHR1_06560005 [Rhizophagus clarus]
MSATPSSTRRTKSATKMSSKTTRTDKQITEETYTPIDIDVITQQNKAKKNRVTADNDADDAFWEPTNTKENTLTTCLALDICNGLRPEFGKGTPEIYKKLAYKCMNANSSQRPTAVELFLIIIIWKDCLNEEYYQEKEEYGYKGKEVKAAFEEADKEIPNISTSYKKNPDAIYTSRLFTFNNLTKPVNSSIITSYLGDEENNNEDNQDPQLVDLEVPSSLLQSKDDDDIDNEKVLITKQ